MAATTDTNQITKIYEIRLAGYDSAHSNLEQLVLDFKAATAAKKELNAALNSGTLDSKQISDVIAKLKDLDLTQAKLINSAKQNTDSTTKATGAYFQLVKQYKDAKAAAEDLAAEFGVNSQQATEAATTLATYKAELTAVQNLIKNGPSSAVVPAESIPLSTTATTAATTEDLALKREEVEINAELEAQRLAEQQQRQERIAAKIAEARAQAGENAALAESVVLVDEQTAALIANFESIVANEQAINANKAAQAAIKAEIQESGTATQSQVTALAELRAEQAKLIESNRLLQVETRNQAREYIATTGSITEMRSQLNLLQAQIANETEGSSEFVRLKEQIDVLNPKINTLEQSLGLFNRNVGNYPQVFSAAYGVLGTELDNIKAKLAAGGLGAKEVADLTAKENALNSALALTQQEFTSTAAAANAYKEANRQIGLAYGVNSETFKNFSAEVAKGNTALKASDTALVSAGTSSNKLVSGFKGIYGLIRQIANILPGAGIATVIGFLLIPLEAVGAAFIEFAKNTSTALIASKDFAAQAQITKDVISESKSEFVKAATNVADLRTQIDAAKNGFANKDVVLKHYNDTIGQTTGKVTTLDQAETELVKNAPAYIQFTLLKAAAQIAQGKAAEKLFEIAETQRKKEAEFANSVVDRTISTGGTGFGGGAFNAAEEKRREAQALAAEKKRKQDLIDSKNKEKTDFEAVSKQLFEEAQAIAKKYGFNVVPDDTKPVKAAADKLNVAEQNALKLIEANRLKLLAIENTSFNEIEKVRQATYQEEIDHLKRLETINVNALNKKADLISKDKTLNTEQARSLAEFGEQRSTIELTTSQKIQAVQKKQFEDQKKLLEAELQDTIAIAEAANKQIQESPTTSNQDKAVFQQATNATIIGLQEDFYKHLEKLNADYNADALQKAKEATEKAIASASQDRLRIGQAVIKDLQAEGERNKNQIEINYAEQIKVILDNEKLNISKKRELIERLTKAENRTILSAELDTLNKQVDEEALLLSQNLVSYDEYLKAVEAAKKKAQELAAASPANDPTKSNNLFARILGFDKGTNEEKAVSEIVAGSFQFAKDAMNDYFDAENDRIQKSLQLAQDRIEADRQVALSQAQSQAEQDSLNKQFDAKKLQAQKDAFDKTKKIKKAEAEINFATEVSTIFSTAYQLGPITGPIVGAVLGALAVTRLGLTLNRIDKQQFAYGGEVPRRGGRFGGKPHSEGGTPFNYDGNNFEAEVKELAVIRTRNASPTQRYTISGNHTQIASMLNRLGGGVDFAPGARAKRYEFGGNLGEVNQAPLFAVNSNGDFTGMIALLDAKTDAINSRIDRLSVIQDTRTVTDAQTALKRKKSVNTL